MISKRRLHLILRIISLTLVFFIFCAFQTSFWPFLTTFIPAPSLWLVFMIFLSFKLKPYPALVFIYFLAFVMTRFTYAPLKVVLMTLIFLHFFIWILKTRIHTSTVFYFSILVGAGTVFYHITYIIVSMWLEKVPTSVFFLHRLADIGLTFLIGTPIYQLLNFINDTFEPNETWSGSGAQLKTTHQNVESESL